MNTRRLKHWGWGYEDQQLDRAALEGMAGMITERLGFEVAEIEEPVPLSAVDLPPSRVKPPQSLKEMFGAGDHERARHTLGKAYRDVIRGMRGEFAEPPDLIAYPESAEDVDSVLSWCADEGYAAIPYGGGTSVVGGIEPRMRSEFPGVVSVDMTRMNRVLEVDAVSRSARIQAGALGPHLEDQLREHGMTMRHFPQSFEHSTLGGWIATRAGGHFATLFTHIDDLVESVEAVTQEGEWRSRRLPGSGAGPSPDRMLIGSEGILGVITEAWVRVQPRPEHRSSVGVAFEDFFAGAEAVRALSQSGLNPSNCRLLDPVESEMTQAGPPGKALLVLGFESTAVPVDGLMLQALEIAREHGGSPIEKKASGGGDDPVGAWKDAFLAAPYLRDSLAACGILSETFETAITWERFEDFHDSVVAAARAKLGEKARISCRFTHVYPDGPAPYFTVLTPAVRGGELAQWDEVKAAASEAICEGGGTITHHHAVGRDHRPWYDRQRPEPFARALRAAKAELDPGGILNPGVLIDVERSPERS